jgi:stage II sporulation protein AA (anti-sigma F factor antagonist)
MVGLTASSGSYDVTLAERDGETVVVMAGEVDLHAAAPLWDAFRRILDGQERLLLDMTAVTFIDSSGVNVLLRAYDELGRREGAVVLLSPSATALRVLKMAGVEGCFTVSPGPPAAGPPLGA